MRFAIALFLFLPFAAAQVLPKPQVKSAPLGQDVVSIYSDFLKTWNEGAKSTLNVADTTYPFVSFEEKALLGRGGCLNGFGKLKADIIVHRLPSELSLASDIRIVDAETHKKRDPGEAILNGEQVDSAVEAGFANGLFRFSEVRFDPGHKLAAFSYSFVCGSLCGNGATVVYELKGRRWSRSKRNCGSWIS